MPSGLSSAVAVSENTNWPGPGRNAGPGYQRKSTVLRSRGPMMKAILKASAMFLAVLAVAVLAGCFSKAVSPVYHKSIHSSYKYDWSADVLSAEPPYKVTWRTDLNGEEPPPGEGEMVLIDRGAYGAWKWRVEGTKDVAKWWQSEISVGSATASERNVAAQSWERGFQRLYEFTAYLLGQEPLPLEVSVRLYPRGTTLSDSVTLTGDQSVNMRIAGIFPAPSDSDERAQDRSHDFREVLAATGGLLQHVELAAGATAAPNGHEAREIKDYANSACWILSVRPALAVGSKDSVIGVPGSIGGGAVRMAKAVADNYPDDDLSLHYYSAVLVMAGMNEYLDQSGIRSPESGTDVDQIKTMLRYCRAFVHYSGDVRDSNMPDKLVDSVDLYEFTPD